MKRVAEQFSLSIDEIVDYLALEKSPRFSSSSASYNVRCPWCGTNGKKHKLNIDRSKNAYRCVSCGQGGGALDLYGRLRFGTPLVPGKSANGGNGNVLYHALMEDLHRDTTFSVGNHGQCANAVPSCSTICRASDDALHRAYSAVLCFPYFSLSKEHEQNLKRRGLDEQAIQINGYRSIPEQCKWVTEWPNLIRTFEQLGLEEKCCSFDRLKRLDRSLLIAGLIVADTLRAAGISMEGVPGFFRIQGNWFFRLEPGMLIPTRNHKGQIVGIQARKDHGSLRYMTVSSKDLPDGVTEGISRTHFPLGNEKLTRNAKVFVTEGPLKADVALSLMKQQTFFIAIQGVNNQKDLRDIFQELHSRGIRQIWNALDMDKLINPNVAAAGLKIRKLAMECGLTMKLQCWDEEYAKTKWLELYLLCVRNRLPVRPMQNVFLDIDRMARLLTEQGIEHSVRHLPDGELEKDYWDDRTKGIDDYLLSIRSK